MRNCDIKFVNKKMTPFGGLSLFFKILKMAFGRTSGTERHSGPRFKQGLQTPSAHIGINLRVYSAVKAVSDILTWCDRHCTM